MGKRCSRKGFALAFGITGFIQIVLGLAISIMWPCTKVLHANIMMGEPALAFGVFLGAASLFMWRKREVFDDFGEENDKSAEGRCFRETGRSTPAMTPSSVQSQKSKVPKLVIQNRDGDCRRLIEQVLENPQYRENARKFQAAIARTRGLALAAELIERAFEWKSRAVVDGLVGTR